MFIDNKYTRIYFSLMKKGKQRKNIEIFEKHHIIPKSLGGDNTIENIVFLSPREHFIAHALLIKMVTELKHKRSMSFAFSRMKQSNNKSKYHRIGNGKLYEKIKVSIKQYYSGENNPFFGKGFYGNDNHFYGKHHSEEVKKYLSDIQKGKRTGNDNHFYGKHHSEEVKKHLSNIRRKPVSIIFLDNKKVFFEKKSDIGKYLNVSKEMGIALCSTSRHLWNKYNIKEILDENNQYSKSRNKAGI